MDDNSFMKRAIELAQKGSGYVHPNPMVGCVIVKNHTIISEGYHEYYGGAHAEVNAIRKLEVQGFDDWENDVSLYVTLEPCVHYGKTPPCTNLIIEKKIPIVVIGSVDANPIVSGKGIKHLQDNGIIVKKGVLENECYHLNKRFFTYHLKKRPYIILKWAESQDGYISRQHALCREENIISSAEALKIVHKWRSEEHSILVGYNTVIADNPRLDVRLVQGKNPIKIIYDKYATLSPTQYNVFRGNEKIIVFNSLKDDVVNNIVYKKIKWENMIEDSISALYSYNIVSVLIEGGAKTLQKFIDARMFDEIRILKSKRVLFKDGIKSPHYEKLECIESIDLQDDVIEIYSIFQ